MKGSLGLPLRRCLCTLQYSGIFFSFFDEGMLCLKALFWVLIKRTVQIRVKVQHSVIHILKLNSSLHLSVNIDFFPPIAIRNSCLIYNIEIHIVLFFSYVLAMCIL